MVVPRAGLKLQNGLPIGERRREPLVGALHHPYALLLEANVGVTALFLASILHTALSKKCCNWTLVAPSSLAVPSTCANLQLMQLSHKQEGESSEQVRPFVLSSTLAHMNVAAQLEEEIQEDLKWSILVKKKLFSGKSDFQTVELIESGPFAKVCTCT